MGYIARQGVFYPTPNTEVPLPKGQVIVSKRVNVMVQNTGTEDIVFVSIVAPVPADYEILLRLINVKALYSIFFSCDRDIFIL